MSYDNLDMKYFFTLLLIAFLGLSPSIILPAHAQGTTTTYQDGLNGYMGTRDATISTQYIEWNEIGITEKDDVSLRAYTVDEEGKAPYEKRALLKFTDLNLPQGATVTDARLTLVVTDWESDHEGTPVTVLKGYYLQTPWNIDAQDLGWTFRDDPDVSWSEPGAKGVGDIVSGEFFTLTAFDSSGNQTKTAKLDNTIVQSWVDNPSANQGILIVNESAEGASTPTIESSEAITQSMRPKLEITYTLQSDDSEPEPTPQENQPPTVSLIEPISSTEYMAPADIFFLADATDDSSVARVEFYQGTTKLSEDTIAPYGFLWEDVSAGTYPDIMAKVFDDQGLMSLSGSVTVTVSEPEPTPEPEPEPTENQMPTVAITSPANDSELTSPANIIITADASDSDGSVSRVDFYRGTQKIGEDSSAPYEMTWSDVGAGEYHISAVAIDNEGGMTGSEAVRLSVIADNLPPTVAITSPANDSELTSTANIIITADASDSDGSVSRVDFYRGTQKIGEDSSAPYEMTWSDVGAGEYHISAVAVDNGGEMTGSEAVHLTVTASNQPPAISITSPLNNEEFTEPANITIEATASDADGTITQVDFYRGTQKIGEDSSAPYEMIWSNIGAGEYHLSAVAIDNGGEITGSEAIHISVTEQESVPSLQPSDSLTVGVDLEMCNSAQLSGNLVYVSTEGNDSTANGSISNPYKTVRAAVMNAQASDTIVLRGGTYAEPQEVRIRVPDVTIRSYPGEWAIIDRSSDMDDVGVYFYVGSDGGALKCAEVIGGFYAVSTETKWDWGDPNDRMGASNILLENVKLHDSHRDVVKIKPQSDDIIIRHAEIYNSGTDLTPGECNAEGIDNVNGDNMHVSYTHIHDTCSTGVYFKGGATDGVVEHSLIENTGAAGIILGFDTSPEYFDLNINPEYYENIRGIARHNLIRNTGWAGIALYASRDAEVYNNTIINSSSIYHSPIYFGITFQDWMPEAGRPANINPSIHHNIISQPVERDAHMISIRQTDELGGLSALNGNLNINNNCYYQAGGSTSFEDSRTQVDQGGWTDDWTGNLVKWRSHINGDTSSYEVDPGLDSNYKPTNSLCAGMGY